MSATQGQPVSNVVKVSLSLSQTPAQGENVDTMLIVGSSSVINVTQRMRTYTSLAAIAVDFGTTAPEYLAATLWFGQSPQPQNLNIGLWLKSPALLQIIGAPLSAAQQLISAWTAITTGAFELRLLSAGYTLGGYVSITGLNFSGVTNLNGVAAIIQTALQASAAIGGSPTCVWNAPSAQFIITYVASTAASQSSLLQPPTANGNATFSAGAASADTLTIGGTAITFVAGTPTGNQVGTAGTAALQTAALLAFLNASTDSNLLKFNYAVLPQAGNSVLFIESKTLGTPGNALTLAKVSTAITVSGATLAGGSGVDISTMTGMGAASSGAFVSPYTAVETAVTAVSILDNLFSSQWYGVAVLGGVDADYLAVAAYIEAATIKHYHGVTTQEAATLTTPGSIDTTSLAYQLMQLKYKKTACQYSSSNPYAIVSYLARILTTDWQANNTTITLMFKQEPGVAGESMSATQFANLLAHDCNVFINYNNNTTIIQPGQSCSGDWTDTIIGADWFAIQVQTDVYNALFTSPTKIPQTDAGMHILATVIEADCIEAVNNGLAAPGVWQTQGFGAISQGSFLPKGYYVYQPLIAAQSVADRAARKSVPFQIALKLGGAVHEADIAIIINQ